MTNNGAIEIYAKLWCPNASATFSKFYVDLSLTKAQAKEQAEAIGTELNVVK